MKISQSTIDVFKNFASINQSIHIEAGSQLRTISPQKSVLAVADIEDEFPQTFAVYDLNRFLNVLSLVEDAELDFTDNSVTIKNGKMKANYNFCDPSIITTPPKKNLEVKDPEIEFKLGGNDLRRILKASGVYQLPEIAVQGDGETISVCAIDSKNPSSDSLSIDVGETELNFNMVFSVENLKLMPRDYDVVISSKGLGKFTGGNLEYYIATNKKASKFEG